MAEEEVSDSGGIPAPGSGKRGESGYIGYLLRQAAAAYHNHLARTLDDLEVTPPQFSVMTMIGAYPGISNAEIARLSFLTPQTASVIVGNLVKAGSVARHAHEVHGRIQQLELTERGQALLQAARHRVHAVETQLTDNMDAQEEARVRSWLAEVAVRMMP